MLEERHSEDPRALLHALLSGIADRIGDKTYRGCPFLNLATEFSDEKHPGRIIARANKEELGKRLASIATRLGVRDPTWAGSQLVMIINGAYATGLLIKPADLKANLIDAAEKLLSLGDKPGRSKAA